jgi:flagellar protein FliO/FliZ
MGIGAVFSSILAVVIALAFVLGLAWGVIWLLKKVQDRQLGVVEGASEARAIKFVRSMPLGQRERVALIEVGDETMLLGVTGGSITLLARWPDDKPAIFPPRPGAAS